MENFTLVHTDSGLPTLGIHLAFPPTGTSKVSQIHIATRKLCSPSTPIVLRWLPQIPWRSRPELRETSEKQSVGRWHSRVRSVASFAPRPTSSLWHKSSFYFSSIKHAFPPTGYIERDKRRPCVRYQHPIASLWRRVTLTKRSCVQITICR